MSDTTYDLPTRIRNHLSWLTPHAKYLPSTALLQEALLEMERLLRGDFTEEEFQNLCHNFDGDDIDRFCHGCEVYQRKLFGDDKWEEYQRTVRGRK